MTSLSKSLSKSGANVLSSVRRRKKPLANEQALGPSQVVAASESLVTDSAADNPVATSIEPAKSASPAKVAVTGDWGTSTSLPGNSPPPLSLSSASVVVPALEVSPMAISRATPVPVSEPRSSVVASPSMVVGSPQLTPQHLP